MYDQRADSASINLTELSKILAVSFNATRLPTPEPPLFSGCALEYHRWKCAFQTLIECKSVKPSEKIHFLERYVAGQANKLIDVVFCYQNNISRYNPVMEVRDKRFGNAFVVSEAIRDILYDRPEMKAPNDTAYTRWICHSGLANPVQIVSAPPAPSNGGPITTFWVSRPCGPAGWLAMFLIKASDVETNPGPTTTRKQVWICDICHRQIQVRKQISIRCNRIEHWVHLRCAEST